LRGKNIKERINKGRFEKQIKIWQIRTGRCLRKFTTAHTAGVLSVCFAKDGFKILSSSFDQTAKIHGLKSGKTMKVYKGHTSFVYTALWVRGGSQIVTGSGDGTIRIWDAKSTDCLNTFRLNNTEIIIQSLQILPKSNDHLVVCNKSNTVYIMNLDGQVLKNFSNGKRKEGDFIGCKTSPKGEWVYCIAEDKTLYCFSVESGKLEHMIPAHEREIIGIDHHPHYNIVCTYSDDGDIKLWKP